MNLIFKIALFSMAVMTVGASPVIIEAENGRALEKSVIQNHYPQWYVGVPSGGRMMRLTRGSFTAELPANETGNSDLWIRLLRMKTFRFRVNVGTVSAEFSEKSAFFQEKGSSFAWIRLPVKLTAGTHEMTLRHLDGNRLEIDCMVLAPAQKTQPSAPPDIRQFARPIYMKVVSHQDEPFFLQMFGRLPRAPWVVGYHNFSKKGHFAGITAGLAEEQRIGKGESTPWMNIAPLLGECGFNTLRFSAIADARRKEPEQSAYTIYFSATPSEQGVFAELNRRGSGSGVRAKLDITDKKLLDSASESAANRDRARHAGTVPGRAPTRFPIGSGLELQKSFDSPDVLANELEAMRLLGLNMLRGDEKLITPETPFQYAFAAHTVSYLQARRGCFGKFRPGYEKTLSELAGKVVNPGKMVFFCLFDEPSFEAEHLGTCTDCQADFKSYSAGQKVSLPGLRFTLDKTQPEAYYWSMRYRSYLFSRFFKQAASYMKTRGVSLPTGINIANAVFSNMLGDGCNWFESARQGGVRYLWGEDWINQNTSFQLSGYLGDLLRSAADGKVPYGLYLILARHPWEIEAKAFTELGRGVKSIQFFNYGPHYATHGDYNSARAEIYSAIKSITHTIGAVEESLIHADVLPGDAALLYSTDSDIWNLEANNMRGRERSFQHLLLRHAGIRADILYDGDLEAKLNRYKVLFVVESHVSKENFERIRVWAGEKNHLLILAPGALSYDRFNRPLAWDFARRPARKVGKLPLHPRRLDKAPAAARTADGVAALDTLEALNPEGAEVLQTYTDGSAAAVRRGNIIQLGFFPGLGYVASGTHHGIVAGPERFYSCTNYKNTLPVWLRKVLGSAVQLKIETDHPLIEANMLTSRDRKLLICANWTGQKRRSIIRFEGRAGQCKSVKQGILPMEYKNGKTNLVLELGPGDIVEILP